MTLPRETFNAGRTPSERAEIRALGWGWVGFATWKAAVDCRRLTGQTSPASHAGHHVEGRVPPVDDGAQGPSSGDSQNNVAPGDQTRSA